MSIISKIKALVCNVVKTVDKYEGYVISKDDSYTYDDYVDDMPAWIKKDKRTAKDIKIPSWIK